MNCACPCTGSRRTSHPVAYVPEEVETWNATFVDGSFVELPHTAQHVKALTRLIGGGGYRSATDQLETL
ncbi:hypothetical protein [Streptomyces acidiscabies]|uniref:Uncharacterized protein n=1 Tax=Streptomyces acidiscabies TaxID=42234 RepID=A0A0L0KH67_9ACTN|nr:hypothetical protein [Streptomyces acidiscabies]KND37203.1 hypothetical protein IQ63_09740 [Streptomyces acidiscabies]